MQLVCILCDDSRDMIEIGEEVNTERVVGRHHIETTSIRRHETLKP